MISHEQHNRSIYKVLTYYGMKGDKSIDSTTGIISSEISTSGGNKGREATERIKSGGPSFFCKHSFSEVHEKSC